jgi:hypothetical protein
MGSRREDRGAGKVERLSSRGTSSKLAASYGPVAQPRWNSGALQATKQDPNGNVS